MGYSPFVFKVDDNTDHHRLIWPFYIRINLCFNANALNCSKHCTRTSTLSDHFKLQKPDILRSTTLSSLVCFLTYCSQLYVKPNGISLVSVETTNFKLSETWRTPRLFLILSKVSHQSFTTYIKTICRQLNATMEQSKSGETLLLSHNIDKELSHVFWPTLSTISPERSNDMWNNLNQLLQWILENRFSTIKYKNYKGFAMISVLVKVYKVRSSLTFFRNHRRKTKTSI